MSALNVAQPVLQTTAKLLNLELDTLLQVPGGTAVGIPTTFGLDEARGGRVFGVVGADGAPAQGGGQPATWASRPAWRCRAWRG